MQFLCIPEQVYALIKDHEMIVGILKFIQKSAIGQVVFHSIHCIIYLGQWWGNMESWWGTGRAQVVLCVWYGKK